MMIYVLDVLHVSVWKTTIIWCVQSVGIVLSSRGWGRIADRHGHRPILVICCLFKSVVTFVFAVVTPELAFPVLLVMFFVDGFLNSGMMVASNGFMMKTAPEAHRPVFISAVTALSGIFAGLSVIAAGWFLRQCSSVRIEVAGMTWNAYQILFLVSMLLRMESAVIVRRIREPRSSGTGVVVDSMWAELQNLLLQVPALVGLVTPWSRRNGLRGKGRRQD
jgi:MFS family permease